jgi:hypothetical protein
MVCAVLGGYYFASTAPPLPQPQCAEIVGVSDILRGQLVREPKKSILDLWKCFREYKKENWFHTTAGIWGTYAVFKVFGPFGAGTSMVLSILIGALYDEWTNPYLQYSLFAHLLGVSGEVIGGAGGWIMSYAIGREILNYFVPEKMDTLNKEMDNMKAKGSSLFRWMMFLRISPLFPNWFVNYATALIGMPFAYFVICSSLAIQPAAYMSISMGKLLREAGEQGLDLGKMAKQGTMMAVTMMVLSLPLIPAEDYKSAWAKVKAKFSGKKQD